jgi:hypothetical protein
MTWLLEQVIFRFIKLKKLRFPANDSGTEFNENLVEKLP